MHRIHAFARHISSSHMHQVSTLLNDRKKRFNNFCFTRRDGRKTGTSLTATPDHTYIAYTSPPTTDENTYYDVVANILRLSAEPRNIRSLKISNHFTYKHDLSHRRGDMRDRSYPHHDLYC